MVLFCALVIWYGAFAHAHFRDPLACLGAFGVGGLLGSSAAYLTLAPRAEKFFSQYR
jgi:hypothetical protein